MQMKSRWFCSPRPVRCRSPICTKRNGGVLDEFDTSSPMIFGQSVYRPARQWNRSRFSSGAGLLFLRRRAAPGRAAPSGGLVPVAHQAGFPDPPAQFHVQLVILTVSPALDFEMLGLAARRAHRLEPGRARCLDRDSGIRGVVVALGGLLFLFDRSP